MTELTGPEESSAQPSRDWPGLDAAAIPDAVVAQALTGLEALPATPVEEHEEAYARLHDELLDALNAKPQDIEPQDLQSQGLAPRDAGPRDPGPRTPGPPTPGPRATGASDATDGGA
ncbi:hypothetical protein SAMN04489743_1847 [Pseudarthrobacter equi]|uniref:Uncharacterized protein n=1 Tax=Pseudarthrobacter equi TaxID=728066 RepID=A0A1H1Y2I9_9MICC|nr:hypothetical protein [Pseudarthrobacter equi]SDT15429.1 hypothetical protein SAMN04489743_1847 [Pseudarthrobacter equi]